MKKYLVLLIFLLLCAFFGFSQGDYRIKSLAFPATGSAKVTKISTSLAGADTASNTNFPTGKAVNDRIRAIAGSVGGTGNPNSNVGSAYRLAIPNTNNIKTLSVTYGLTPDSSTTNQINVKLDSTTVYNRVKQIVNDSVSKPITVDNIGTGQTAVYTNNADSMHLKTHKGVNSISVTTNPSDSTLYYQLVHDTTASPRNYKYGFDSTGRLGFSPSGVISHLISTGSVPSITAGAGAGTSPTVSVLGNDAVGTVTVITGSSPTAGQVIVTITFTAALSSSAKVILQPANQAVGSATVFPTISVTGSTTNFYINTNTVTGLVGATTYSWNYMVVQ